MRMPTCTCFRVGGTAQIVRSNNDYRPVISNAVIETGLEPGTYTVEATTNARGERGSFELISRVRAAECVRDRAGHAFRGQYY